MISPERTCLVALDWSMTSPGICIFKDTSRQFNFQNCLLYSRSVHYIEHCRIKNIDFDLWKSPYLKTDYQQTQRFDQISNWAMNIIKPLQKDFDDIKVVMEGYSHASKGLVFNIAENGGALKTKLFKAGLEFECVAPKFIKKFYTSNGNADKEQMHEAFAEETGIDLKKEIQPTRKLESPTTDIIDAYAICKWSYFNLEEESV